MLKRVLDELSALPAFAPSAPRSAFRCAAPVGRWACVFRTRPPMRRRRDSASSPATTSRRSAFRFVRGRAFSSADLAADSIASIIVNEALVEGLLPHVDPIGQVFRGGFGPPQRIVGVVADVAEGTLTERMPPTRLLPRRPRSRSCPAAQSIVVRTTRPEDAERRARRRAAHRRARGAEHGGAGRDDDAARARHSRRSGARRDEAARRAHGVSRCCSARSASTA